DRQDFIPAGDLRPGESLLSEVGLPVYVVRAELRLAPALVYNLEVNGEHVYAVTEAGVLVHNSCGLTSRMIGKMGEAHFETLMRGRANWRVLGAIQNRSGHGIDLVAEYTTRSGKTKLFFF